MDCSVIRPKDCLVRDLAARVLNWQGYTVLEATNGREALGLAQKYDKEIHLLLTDMIMPQMGGKVLADQIKNHFPHIKILFTSGYTNNAIVEQGGVLAAGIEFIQKPFSSVDLAHKVRKVLDQDNG